MRLVPNRADHPLRQLWMGGRAIGASSAHVILYGKVSYGRQTETAYEKWEYLTKRREKEPQTPQMLEGLKKEPLIRKRWEDFIRLQGEPMDVIDDEHDFLRAQIDWMSYDGTRIADFKHTTSEWLWEQVQKLLSNSNCLLEGSKLDNWYTAAQHQMMVTGTGMIDYYVLWQDFGQGHFMVPRNDSFIERLRAKEIAFWNDYVLTDTPPPKRKLKVVKDTPVEQEGRK